MTELPDGVFRLLISLFTGGAAGVWLVHDLVLLARVARQRGADRRDPLVALARVARQRRAGRRDPLVGDQMFGYAIGIVIGVIGLVGTLRFNGVF
jgi:hypothetical protein